MIWCNYYKKKTSSAEISSHISHIMQSPNFSVSSIQGISQILQVVPSSSSSLLSSFDDSAKWLHYRDGLSCCFSWGISWEPYLMVSSFLFLFFSFCCNSLQASHSLRHLSFPGTAKNTVISPSFLVWKFCGKGQF